MLQQVFCVLFVWLFTLSVHNFTFVHVLSVEKITIVGIHFLIEAYVKVKMDS